MKAYNNTKSIVLGLVSALAIGIASPIHAQAPEPATEQEGKKMPMSEKSMMDSCEKMKQEMSKMMKATQTADAELTELVHKMNSAPEGEKMTMIADIVTKMVTQRANMHDQAAKMQGKIMRHVMMHIRMGKDSCDKCPMMKDTVSDEKDTASDGKAESP